MNHHARNFSRRDFLKTASAATLATLASGFPRQVLAYSFAVLWLALTLINGAVGMVTAGQSLSHLEWKSFQNRRGSELNGNVLLRL